jgi:hypothetical protein
MRSNARFKFVQVNTFMQREMLTVRSFSPTFTISVFVASNIPTGRSTDIPSRNINCLCYGKTMDFRIKQLIRNQAYVRKIGNGGTVYYLLPYRWGSLMIDRWLWSASGNVISRVCSNGCSRNILTACHLYNKVSWQAMDMYKVARVGPAILTGERPFIHIIIRKIRRTVTPLGTSPVVSPGKKPIWTSHKMAGVGSVRVIFH